MRIGIIGGGQLAAMLVQACSRKNAKQGSDHQIYVLDADPKCPAVQAGGIHVPGHSATGEGYAALGKLCDIVTIDLENVAVQSLEELELENCPVIPETSLLVRMTNKLEQKRWLQELQLPTAKFLPHDGNQEITEEAFGFPVVQKAATGGYDGRGVAVIREAADNDSRLLTTGYLEQYIERKMEVSVMVAADGSGAACAYQPVEMVFHEGGNVLDYLVAPARLDETLLEQAKQLAIKAITAMNGHGIFGIEMFLTEDDQLLINEISPRTHNSGHYTTEACATSQFTQQLNILTGKSLGDVSQNRPAVMFNLLGAEGFEGDTVVEQDQLPQMDEVSIHLYGKEHCFPGRKMGHVTILAETASAALNKMVAIRDKIQVRGADPLA